MQPLHLKKCKKNPLILVFESKQRGFLKLQFFCILAHRVAPIVFSWPLSSNVPRKFWWHMDTSMYPPSDRRILSELTTNTSVLDGVYPSIGSFSLSSSRICIQLPPYPQTTLLLLSWTMYSAIYRVSYKECPYFIGSKNLEKNCNLGKPITDDCNFALTAKINGF